MKEHQRRVPPVPTTLGFLFRYREHWTIKPLRFSPPPVACFAMRFAVGEVVIIDNGSDVARRFAGKWIALKQTQDFGRTLQQAHTEIDEPPIALIVTERGKPHLPIETRLVRRDKPRTALEVAWLVFEFVRHPGLPVVAAFDDDFGALCGHHGEQAVAVHAAKGLLPRDKFR